MVKIHHAKQSRSMRVVWLAEELELPYDIVPIEMFSDAMKAPDFLKVHPLGKVPAIEDGDFVLWETTAILTYLDSKYGAEALVPPGGTEAGAQVAQWMGFGENPLTIIMGEIASHGGAMPADRRIPALVDRGNEMAPALVRVVERALGDQPFICGDAFTAADIMLGFGLGIAVYLNFVNAETPRCQAYLERLQSRPAFLRASQV
ncbi:MAG: glutathione S-transferase family protein [Myxococcota bacterium]